MFKRIVPFALIVLFVSLIGCDKQPEINSPQLELPDDFQKILLLQEKWEDFFNNPVLSSTNSSWDIYGPHQCKILKDGDLYNMWFGNLIDFGISFIGYAQSSDGITWTRPVNGPVMSPTSGTWDAGAVIAGPVRRENNVFKMYYNGWQDQYKQWMVGLAASTDGVNWQKHPQPILSGIGGDARIVPGDILKIGNTYFLYYHYGKADAYPDYKIGVALSSDGINFTKYSGNPILVKSATWEQLGVTYPSIIKDRGIYYMYYSNASESIINSLGIAYSTDGLSWTKSNYNPFFTDQDPSIQWRPEKVVYPYVLKMKNEFRIYYTGQKGGDPGYRHIAYVTREIIN